MPALTIYNSYHTDSLFCLTESAVKYEHSEVALLAKAALLQRAIWEYQGPPQDGSKFRLFYETNDKQGLDGFGGPGSTYGDWIVLEHRVQRPHGEEGEYYRVLVIPVSQLSQAYALVAMKIACATNCFIGKRKRRSNQLQIPRYRHYERTLRRLVPRQHLQGLYQDVLRQISFDPEWFRSFGNSYLDDPDAMY